MKTTAADDILGSLPLASFSTLDEFERKGRIRVFARERMPFAPSINNDGFLYCWEPT
jgi:hypothetical protein